MRLLSKSIWVGALLLFFCVWVIFLSSLLCLRQCWSDATRRRCRSCMTSWEDSPESSDRPNTTNSSKVTHVSIRLRRHGGAAVWSRSGPVWVGLCVVRSCRSGLVFSVWGVTCDTAASASGAACSAAHTETDSSLWRTRCSVSHMERRCWCGTCQRCWSFWKPAHSH